VDSGGVAMPVMLAGRGCRPDGTLSRLNTVTACLVARWAPDSITVTHAAYAYRRSFMGRARPARRDTAPTADVALPAEDGLRRAGKSVS
jgi:hypothetical protein